MTEVTLLLRLGKATPSYTLVSGHPAHLESLNASLFMKTINIITGT